MEPPPHVAGAVGPLRFALGAVWLRGCGSLRFMVPRRSLNGLRCAWGWVGAAGWRPERLWLVLFEALSSRHDMALSNVSVPLSCFLLFAAEVKSAELLVLIRRDGHGVCESEARLEFLRSEVFTRVYCSFPEGRHSRLSHRFASSFIRLS